MDIVSDTGTDTRVQSCTSWCDTVEIILKVLLLEGSKGVVAGVSTKEWVMGGAW